MVLLPYLYIFYSYDCIDQLVRSCKQDESTSLTLWLRPIQAGSTNTDPNPILNDVLLLSEVGSVQQTKPLEGFPIPMPKMRRL